jgi:D-glycero-D-manno-heptose 1,7-bisphosphate phosphatase
MVASGIMAGGRKGLILDRDGVVNLDTGYLHRIEECRFVDGIFALASVFQSGGFRLAIATNQSGIGRGLFTPQDFRRLMAWIRGEFEAHGLVLDAIYHAPDHPSEGQGRYRRDTPWRKPGPGMFRQAIADLGLDPAASWSVGDRAGDLAAAEAAGIGHRVLLDPGAGSAPARHPDGYWIVSSLVQIPALGGVSRAG